MSVHYKFKSTLDFDTITFDGLHISVGDLKRSIVKQKHLGKLTDFDLQITNAQTKEEYTDDNSLIPKNTSLIIARVPLSHQSKKSWENLEKNFESRNLQKVDNVGLDISKMKGSEEEKIQAMMLQSTADYDPKSYQKIRSQPQTGEVPPTYRCNKCKKGGHWIKNCPFNLTKEFSDVKRNTGIPKSFQNRDEKQLESEKQEQSLPAQDIQQEIPDDLICSMCHDLFTDAVMIPCCGSSFCDDCVRTALLESEDNECPDCKEKGSSPASLIPNRFLRNSVNAFKNATGYKTNELKIAARTEHSSCKNQLGKKSPETENENISNSQIQEDMPQNENTKTDTPQRSSPEKIIAEPAALSGSKEKQGDVPAHDDVESDFEDNITIKMPPTQIVNQSALFREKSFNGRNTRHPKPPGIESSPQRQLQDHNDKQRSPTRIVGRVEWDRDFRETCAEQNAFEVPSRMGHSSSDQYNRDMQDRRHRLPNTHDMFPGTAQRLNMNYQHIPPGHLQMNPAAPMQTHHILPFNNLYNQMDPRSNMSFPNFVRQPFPSIRPGCVPMRGPPNDVRQGMTSNLNLASVYQGVAAKVGTGIIDDPLEAFNRIMKEKEKRKEERRRTPDQRRSRSPDRHQRNRYRMSPVNRRVPREQLTREKHEHFRDKRDRRDRDRDNSNRDKIFRHKRSTSFSDRSSRSRSWSISPQRRRSRSPVHYRRSRSRPHNFNEKRSRSYGRTRGLHVIKHTSAEEKSFKRDIRSPSPVKRGEEFLPGEGSKKHNLDPKSDALEPPPPGFEFALTTNYQWGQKEKRLYDQSPDTYEQHLKHERKKFDSRTERSLSKSSSNSNEKSAVKLRSKSPNKKSFEDRRKENLLPSNDIVKGQQPNRRENAESQIDKHEKEHKNTLTTREKVASKPSKNIVKRNDKEVKLDTVAIHPENKERIPSPKFGYSAFEEKVDNQFNDVLKGEKRGKERKKKSKKEKLEKKKLKKDKKEKRDRNKHSSSANEKGLILEKESNISTDAMKKYTEEFVDLNVTKTQTLSDKREPASDKEKSDKFAEHDFKDPVNFHEGLNENRLSEPLQEVNFLYDDIGDLVESQEENIKSKENSLSKRNTPPATFGRFDSVLDIHGYDTDFDENKSYQNQKVDKVHMIAPMLSKWELDEQNFTSQAPRTLNENNSCYQISADVNDDKVTNEVLRKAENAIFARAINAIRPIEGKKQSTDHVLHRSSIEESPPSNLNKQKESLKSNLKDFQITIPIGNTHERSVELKPEKSRNLSHSPNRSKPSIKDRLGSKIVHKEHTSPHLDANFHKQRSRRERSSDCNMKSNHRSYSNTFRERVQEQERSKDRNHSSIAVKKSLGGDTHLRQRSRDRKREENFDYHKERDRDKNNRYYERDARKKVEDRLQGQRPKSDYHYSDRNKHDNVNKCFDSNKKHLKKYANEQNVSHISGNDRGDAHDRKSTEINYLDLGVTHIEQARVTVNPFRKNVAVSDLILSGNGERDNKKRTHIPNKESCSSSESGTEEELDDSKRKKKRKDRKEKKRVRRLSSGESTESARKKHKKKKNKSSKKKKKNKKHEANM